MTIRVFVYIEWGRRGKLFRRLSRRVARLCNDSDRQLRVPIVLVTPPAMDDVGPPQYHPTPSVRGANDTVNAYEGRTANIPIHFSDEKRPEVMPGPANSTELSELQG